MRADEALSCSHLRLARAFKLGADKGRVPIAATSVALRMVDFDPSYLLLYFRFQLVVLVSMIDDSEKRNR